MDELKSLQHRARHIRVHCAAPGANPELVAAYRVTKMLKLAQCVAYGALQREESRGAHFREDFPLRNDRDWLKRTLATWEHAEQDVPTLNYEALDIMQMELPPGWRGYGGKERIDHPDTAQRQQQVEQIEQQGLDRFKKQSTLMPYDSLLPQSLRGRNERLDEPLKSEARV